jgi:hypothetical protein
MRKNEEDRVMGGGVLIFRRGKLADRTVVVDWVLKAFRLYRIILARSSGLPRF